LQKDTVLDSSIIDASSSTVLAPDQPSEQVADSTRSADSSSSSSSSNINGSAKIALPIDACRDDILKLVADNQFVVITGDTGSGKSTQLAQMLHSAGYGQPSSSSSSASRRQHQSGQIAITQPRRVGAVSVSRRVAQEMGVQLGEEVGYTIRFEDCSSPRTRIRFFTDGCLLRDALVHKNLEPYRFGLNLPLHFSSWNGI
jgi:HrpA-like RNA helicase